MSEALKKARKAKRYSLRAIINAKCKECIYDSSGGNGAWRQQTEACTSFNCPLYPVRPISTGDKS